MEFLKLDIAKINTFLSYYGVWEPVNIFLMDLEWNTDSLLKYFDDYVLFCQYRDV
jgi:hypothetical protein